MSTDKQLKQSVLDELNWEPSVNSANIGVTTKDGVVTLMGHVDTYAQTGVSNQITIKPRRCWRHQGRNHDRAEPVVDQP